MEKYGHLSEMQMIVLNSETERKVVMCLNHVSYFVTGITGCIHQCKLNSSSFSLISLQVSKIFIIFTYKDSLRIVFHQSIKMDTHIQLYHRRSYTEMVILQQNILITWLFKSA